jgi:hypothetical protein
MTPACTDEERRVGTRIKMPGAKKKLRKENGRCGAARRMSRDKALFFNDIEEAAALNAGRLDLCLICFPDQDDESCGATVLRQQRQQLNLRCKSATGIVLLATVLCLCARAGLMLLTVISRVFSTASQVLQFPCWTRLRKLHLHDVGNDVCSADLTCPPMESRALDDAMAQWCNVAQGTRWSDAP